MPCSANCLSDCVLEFEEFLGDSHFQLVYLAQVREAPILFTVKNLFAVKEDFQTPFAIWGHFQSNITRIIRVEEFVRQPRGDGEISSRYAIKNFDFNFSVLASLHFSPNS